MLNSLLLIVLALSTSMSGASPQSSIQKGVKGLAGELPAPGLPNVMRPLGLKKRNNSVHATRTLPIVGQLLPTLKLQVDICIDLTISLFGRKIINLSAAADLAASIAKDGISVKELAIVQAQVDSLVQASALSATSLQACQRSCGSDRCSKYSWDSPSKTCTLVPQTLSPKSSIIANLISQLALSGSSSPDYCELCAHRCSSTPTMAPRFRKRQNKDQSKCPTGFSACPISASSTLRGYECLNTQEELESCGGCATAGKGVNCNTVTGFKRAGCNQGKCLAFECSEGFQLTSEKTCVKRAI